MPASPPSLISFSEACARSERYTKRHVVLGNGFSIACKPSIFAYKALFDRAQFASATDLTRRVFDVLDTHDFEEVMRALRDAAKLVRSVDPKYSGLAAD